MKYRRITSEEAKQIKTNHYDSGFSLWIKQPGLHSDRCIMDASLLYENGIIKLHPPTNNEDFKFGSIIGKDDEILIVAIE